MFRKPALIVIASLAFASASAGETTRVNIEGIGSVVHERIEEFKIETQDMHAFALEASERLLAYSEATGYEACGMIAKSETEIGVVITSNHSHIACAIQTREVPEGMIATGVDIHSHGLGAIKMNRSDMLFFGIRENARSRHIHGTVYGQDRNMFSATDLALGEGYLAAPGGTLYHDGKGTVSKIRANSP